MATSAVQSVLVKRSSEEAGLNELCAVKEEPDHVDPLPATDEEANADGLDDGEPLFHLDVDDGCEPETDEIPENEKTTDSEAAADLERLEKMVNEGDAGPVKKEEDEQDGAREGEGVGCSEGETEGNSGRSPKKPRLVWTSELHARFMNAVNHLGIKNAVPTTILKLMNVEGMTRENVASHLQKYRLYVKRMAGLPPGARLPSEPVLLPANGLAHMPALHSGLVPAASTLSVPVYVRQPPGFLSSYQSRQGVATGTSVRPILPAPYFASGPTMPQLVQTISPYQGAPATHVVVGGPHQGMPPPVLMRSYSATTPLASQAQALTHSYPMSTAVGVPVSSAPVSTFYQQPYQIATGVPPSGHVQNQPMQLYAPYGSQPATGQPACVSSSWTPSVTANPLPDASLNNAVTGSPAVQSGQPAAPMGIPIMQGRPLSHVHSAPVMPTGAQPAYQSWGTPAATLQPLQVMGAPAASGLMMSSGNEAEGLPVTTVAPPPVAPSNAMPEGCLPPSQPGTAAAAAQQTLSLPPEPTANGFELQSAFVPLALEGNGECGSSTDGCPVELALEHQADGEGDGAGTLENGDRSTLTLSEPDDGGVWSHSWTQDWCGDPANGRHL